MSDAMIHGDSCWKTGAPLLSEIERAMPPVAIVGDLPSYLVRRMKTAKLPHGA